jgi:NAD(P)-dependent dehydrogenase (short-subunit alcohol dehydrogenase family)
MTFAGRTAVVTGAGSGIGRALALELSRRGARVAVSDVDKDAVTETARACADAHPFELDVTDREAVFAHAEEVAALGPVGLVVNNAGVAVHGLVRDLSEQDMRWVMEIDYWGVVHGSQAFLPHLTAAGTTARPARLVNISSLFGLVAVPAQSAYSAAKFAVRGFTEALVQEVRLERAPVTVSCVHPGGIRTGIARSARVAGAFDKESTAAAFDRLARMSPERAATIILDGAERGRPRIMVGADAHLVGALPRLLGSGYQRVIALGSQRLGPR